MNGAIIGWSVEHVVNNIVESRYVRSTESEAQMLLNDLKENELFKIGEWRKEPVYSVA